VILTRKLVAGFHPQNDITKNRMFLSLSMAQALGSITDRSHRQGNLLFCDPFLTESRLAGTVRAWRESCA